MGEGHLWQVGWVRTHQTTLSSLAEQHVGLDDQPSGIQPWLGVSQRVEVRGLSDLPSIDINMLCQSSQTRSSRIIYSQLIAFMRLVTP